VSTHPGRRQQEAQGDERVPDRALAGADPSADERCGGDQRPPPETRDEAAPRLGTPEGMPREQRSDREEEQGRRDDEEAAREQQVEPPPIHREAQPREQSHDPCNGHRQGLQDEPELGQLVGVAQLGMRQEERKRRPEQAEEQDLPDQIRLEDFVVVVPHRHSCRQNRACR